ncbi:hypothetical protein [Sphingosinicella sp. YJ22]|uniref:hypothetical protein n=1 Tax=Sphingosinicella sp. YJ22 TaxID=1104780 RepID=UPI00140BF6F0|nr:hypothetical protein [Sphingosinicella sp. YJ22]
MALSVLLAAALLAAAQQPSPPIGQRSSTPEQMLRELGLAPSPDEEAAAIAAAQRHPLGTMENPVRVGGPTGERAYIARLRCGDGSAPRVGQRGNMGVGAFGTIVDAYPLDCGSAAPGRFTLIMDMYHDEHREERAPAGFTIVPE